MSTNFKDGPLQLVAIKEEGILEITIEAINFLSELNGQKLAIICVSGPLKTGKSLLLNTFLNNGKGFGANTQGLYIWGRPIELENGTKLLLLDSQGLSKSEGDISGQKLFILSLLLSTCLIYNTNGGITDQILSNFAYFTDLANKISITPDNNDTKNNIDNLSEYFPELIWGLRDFQMKDKDPNDYLNEILINNPKSEKIQKLFKKRTCCFFPSPFMSEEDSQNPTDISKLNPEFIKAANSLLSSIKKTIPIKKIEKFEIDGDSLFGILQNYLDSMNNDENPLISLALKNVLLSKAKNISEQNFETFKNEMSKTFENKYPMSYTEIYKQYFEYQDKEITKFCNDVQDTLTVIQTGDYLNKLCVRMRTELENVFETNKEFYDDWFDIEYKELEKNLSEQNLTKLSEIKQFFANYSAELQKGLNKFLDIRNSDFCKNLISILIKIVQDHVTNKLAKIGETISEMYEKFTTENASNSDTLNANLKRLNEQLASEKKLLEERSKEKNELYGSFLELETKFDKLTRELKAKEKDFDNSLNIEYQKYQKMENYYINEIKEKDNIISKLEAKLDKLNTDIIGATKENSNKFNELNKENVKLQEEIGKMKEQGKQVKGDTSDNKSLNYQSLVKSIKNTFLEFQESLDKLYSENKDIDQTKNLEFSIKEIENKSRNWLDIILLFRDNQIETMKDSYEKKIKLVKDEVEELSFELEKSNYALNEQIQMKDTYQAQIKLITKQLEEAQELSESKNNLIATQEKSLKLFEEENIDLKKIRDDLELNLNQNIVNYKMKEDELETLLIVIEGMLSRKKDKYEHNLSRLSSEIKTTIQAIVDKYKFFK